MDIQALAQQLTAFLAPLLPYLLKAGEKAAEELGKKAVGGVWEQAKALWARLREKKRVATAAEAAAALQDNPALREALREEIARALAEDPVLAAEVARLWEKAQATGATVTTVTAVGDRSVAVGGDVRDSTIITGNRNEVKR